MSTDASAPGIDDLWDFNNPAESEKRFADLLASHASTTPTAWRAEVLTQLARSQGLQRRFADADATLDSARALLSPGPSRGRARLLLERGRVLNSSRKPAEAVPIFEEALAVAQVAGEENLAVDAAHMLGIAAPPDEALAWNHRAIAMAEAATDPKARAWLGSLYNNTGWTHHDRGEFEQSLNFFRKSTAFRRERGQRRETQIGVWCEARATRSLGRVEEALAMQLELHKELAADGVKDGYCDEEIAECLLLLGRSDEARPYFRRAWDALSEDQWLKANEAPRLERLRQLGGG